MKNFLKLKTYGFALLAAAAVTACQDSIDRENPPIPYPDIGGFKNSDEIQAGSLVAKLSFENSFTDKEGSFTNPQPHDLAFTGGAKGLAYNGSSSVSRYVVTDASTKITGLNDFTLAFWMNSEGTVDPNPPGQGKGAQGIFSLVRPTEFWGGINVFLENPDSSKPDRIRLKLGVENSRPGVAWRGQGVIANIDGMKGKWMHVAFAYNSAESKCYVYVNGEPAQNLDGFAYSPAGGATGGYASWFADNPGGLDNPNNAPGYGTLQLGGTNGKAVFGTHQFMTTPPLNNGGPEPWATSYAGKLDEFRVYKTALKSAEVNALYRLEKDGR